ncbi:glutamate-1-semialdehyde 2,1-aminomutase [Absicoccus intestinalis]|uniref:Glutamate-1-semialdehyde 2,1-aminomutase n=1 Tax=Absicoccus intestinalis TaxID=2926319 RepID=A0ABU4WL14_9FIRM|nr:glutamate-1-semialdehyde 2,1-aminomutase [Absicoccus sp. CLA-KB-P134]MDX8417259.1 glutamate-1-semialdehyde 2,1-aminomutase [Absicoccus sp. CLA-KB-P134]
MHFDHSEKAFAQASELMPGGVNSPVRAFQSVGGTPLFIDHAQGDKVMDIDGNTFIDYVCSWGPGILGHAHPQVIQAVQKACSQGLTFGAPTQKESELAQLVQQAYPAVEKLRLVSSGTEACMSAIRAARGYTHRDYIIKCIGCYHGHSDGLLVKAGSGLLTQAVANSDGVPEGYTKTTLLAPYNDEKAIQQLFERYPHQIAALIIEPVAANMGVVPPKPGYLQFLRKITQSYDTVLIFDEVITGFRLALGGASQYYGIQPDMATFGKIIGGGMPLAAYGGKKEIMDVIAPIGSVYQAGTLSGNPIATTAGIETLKILMADPDIYERIDQKAKQLAQAYRKKSYTVNQVGSLMSVFFTNQEVVDYQSAKTSDTQAFANYFHTLLDHGIYVAPSQFEAMFISDAHDQKDIQKTIQIIQEYV